MATYITVEQQVAQQLLEDNARQTAANRAGLARQERARRSARQVPPAVPQINPSARRPLADEELAATRRRGGGFGFFDVNGGKATSTEPYFAAKYKINPQDILFKYKVIRINVADANDGCAGRNTLPAPFFAGAEASLSAFLNTGGVLWINNEFQGCGINPSVFNAYLAATFGATIGFVDDWQPEGTPVAIGPFAGVVRNSLSYTAQTGLAPPYYYTAATSSISGGTPYYSSAHGPVCSFERIGAGFLVLSGDSNGTAEFPSFTEGAKTFIDALRALR